MTQEVTGEEQMSLDPAVRSSDVLEEGNPQNLTAQMADVNPAENTMPKADHDDVQWYTKADGAPSDKKFWFQDKLVPVNSKLHQKLVSENQFRVPPLTTTSTVTPPPSTGGKRVMGGDPGQVMTRSKK